MEKWKKISYLCLLRAPKLCWKVQNLGALDSNPSGDMLNGWRSFVQNQLVRVAYPFEALCVASSQQLMPAIQEWIIYKARINDAFRKHFVFCLIKVNCMQNGIQQVIIYLPCKVVIAIQVEDHLFGYF